MDKRGNMQVIKRKLHNNKERNNEDNIEGKYAQLNSKHAEHIHRQKTCSKTGCIKCQFGSCIKENKTR